jgi:hypothetical protein
MSNTKTNLENNSLEIWEKITNLSELKGQTVSSMITLVIPPKYCI